MREQRRLHDTLFLTCCAHLDQLVFGQKHAEDMHGGGRLPASGRARRLRSRWQAKGKKSSVFWRPCPPSQRAPVTRPSLCLLPVIRHLALSPFSPCPPARRKADARMRSRSNAHKCARSSSGRSRLSFKRRRRPGPRRTVSWARMTPWKTRSSRARSVS